MPDSGSLLSCSFCGKTQKQVKKLIAGTAGVSAIATIQLVNDAAGAEPCSFCGKRLDQVAAMAWAGDRRICDQCLELCDRILSEEPPIPLR
jgi:ATP-dependent protease Clp ATPase subunit